jgi:demethylmenaquinone methyltransferase/2-methoxy-6-polyprenyl-1,4-benzoquinol methylase
LSLRAELSTPDGKRRYVRRLFATIADKYDFVTVFLSWGQDRRWKRRLIELARLTASDRVLDLACGTGDLLFAACPPAGSAVGMDVTLRMIELAARKRRRGTQFVVGDMHTLPFNAQRFDVVTTGYGLRNVSDIGKAVGEIYRVLAPGGRFLSLDFNRPRNPVVRAAFISYLTVVGSVLGWALHRDPDTYRYIPESIRRYPGADGVAHLLRHEGFVGVQSIRVLGGLMAIHVAHKA